MSSKVIWLTPCFQSEHLIPRFIEHQKKLDPQPDLYVFSENNSTDNTLKLLVESDLPHEIIRTWFVKDAVKRSNRYSPMSHIMQLLLTKARRLDPDFAIISACDVFVKSYDAIDILTSWNVDCVAARILRWFPQGIFISAKWEHPTRKGYQQMTQRTLRLFDETPLMVGFGLVCLSRKVIQDKRINFYPIPKSPKEGDQCSEDFGYCLQLKQNGYNCCLDGIVEAEHVLVDVKNRAKAWTVGENFEYP